jgi:hypothetical protein
MMIGVPVAALLLAAGMNSGAAAQPRISTADQCAHAREGQWSAHVNAMPGPNARRSLIVVGRARLAAGVRARLRLSPAVMESHPPQFAVFLEINPGRSTRRPVPREVRGQWPVRGDVGAVHIQCGGRTIRTIRDVVTAH